MKNYFSLASLTLLAIFCGQITAMEQDQNNNNSKAIILSKNTSTVKDAKQNLGILSVLSDEIIAEILLRTIDWDEVVLKEACAIITKSGRLVNKYLYALIHERLLNAKSIENIKCYFKRLKEGEVEIENYKVLNYAKIPGYLSPDLWNGLHIASYLGDLEFVKKVLPKLSKRNKRNLLNQHCKTLGLTPLGLIHISVREDVHSLDQNGFMAADEKFAELASELIKNGSVCNIMDHCGVFTDLGFVEIAGAIVKGSKCKDIRRWYQITFDENTRKVIRQNHKCDTCKFIKIKKLK